MKDPIQYVLCGLPFSGKTTLAEELEKRLGYARVNIDEIKSQHGFAGVSDDDISDDQWTEIFNDLESRVVNYLKKGQSVLSETAWINKTWRNRARKVASIEGIDTKIIYIEIPESVVRDRWLKNKQTKERFDIPEKVFEESIRDFEIPSSDETVIIYKESMNLDSWISDNFKE